LELFSAGPGAMSSVALQHRLERAALDRLHVIPLLHFRDTYMLQPGLEQIRLDHGGMLDLANAWKK
jgi:MarR-like DNA-binding transcriptional regulator SgrR of sgrS sRNA